MKISTSSALFKFIDRHNRWGKWGYLGSRPISFCELCWLFVKAVFRFSWIPALIAIYILGGMYTFWDFPSKELTASYITKISLIVFFIAASSVIIILVFAKAFEFFVQIIICELIIQNIAVVIYDYKEKRRLNRNVAKKEKKEKKEKRPGFVMSFLKAAKARVVDKTCVLVEFEDKKKS